jgi:ethanolamine transporter EutH
MDWIVFLVFAAVVFGMYVALRRQLWPARRVIAVGVAVACIAMILHLTLRAGPDDTFLANVIFGVLIGGGVSLAAVAAAWFFNRGAARAAESDPMPDQTGSSAHHVAPR